MYGHGRACEIRGRVGESVLTHSASTTLADNDMNESIGFSRQDGVMYAEGVPLPSIAASVGTPVYVYSANTIRARYRQLEQAFDGIPHHIHFAMKSNSNLSVLRLLQELGAGVDIVSGGELYRAREAGFGGGDVVFSGVGKTVREMDLALEHRVLLINVESEPELYALNAVAEKRGVVAGVAIRVNPEVFVDTHDYINTGSKGAKFGIPIDDVSRIADVISTLAHVKLLGLGMHLGSQIATADPMRDALPKLLATIEQVRKQGHALEFMDVGGGLSVPYEGEAEADVAGYASVVGEAVKSTGLQLLLEPGRFLVAESGVLLTEVLYRKHSAGKDFVVTDAGMSDLVRPALYGAYHHIEAVIAQENNVTADVVGPICESGDFFAKERVLGDVKAGELLAIQTAGAYGYAMSSNYNSRPRPAEVLVDGDRFAIISERERFEDLVRLERAHLQWRSA